MQVLPKSLDGWGDAAGGCDDCFSLGPLDLARGVARLANGVPFGMVGTAVEAFPGRAGGRSGDVA